MANTNSVPSVFQFNETQLRVITDDHGELWFVAADVCAALEMTVEATRRLDDDEKGLTIIQTPGGDQQVTALNESGLYSLVLRSRKPEAKRFKKWVTSEVLPTIRKTGRYEVPKEETISPAQQRQLQNAVAEHFPEGKQRPYAWSRFNNHFQLGSYKQLPSSKFDDAMEYISTMPGAKGYALTENEQLAMDKLRHGRFMLYFTETGRMVLREVPQAAFFIAPNEIADVIGDPGSMVGKNLLPGIISAAAKRLG